MLLILVLLFGSLIGNGDYRVEILEHKIQKEHEIIGNAYGSWNCVWYKLNLVPFKQAGIMNESINSLKYRCPSPIYIIWTLILQALFVYVCVFLSLKNEKLQKTKLQVWYWSSKIN